MRNLRNSAVAIACTIGCALSSTVLADDDDDDVHTTADHKHTNRLVNETSPYLLQHAHNPVDWYPWGEEAFAAARAQDKPIFLSVGYSTCYWCHVMERESFENEEIAALMNEYCICIKVDREERPDVDDIYMQAVQIMTNSGGWPMSVFLEPHELKPFYGGTYFPSREMSGHISFPDLLKGIGGAWESNRDQINAQANQIASLIQQRLNQQLPSRTLDGSQISVGRSQLMSGFDTTNGGFGGGVGYSPKFPMPANLEFLLEAGWDDDNARAALLMTLDKMALGGMYDQVGGGFHRYSTDAQWLVPHFEKMLYDNGQLASAYARAYELTDDPFYAEITAEIIEYVLREMTHFDGPFFSAQDAEVNAREGQNYLWMPDQIRGVLEEAGLGADVDLVLRSYGMTGSPNFQDPHHRSEPPQFVIQLVKRPEQLAADEGLPIDEFNAKLAAANEALLNARDLRDQPGLDDKVILSWNGLMITGLADAGRALGNPDYVESAATAASFLLKEMNDGDGGLLRTWRNGDARIPAFLEDYALFIRGLIALHKADAALGIQRDPLNWLAEAGRLVEAVEVRFGDADGGGYFDTLDGQSDLFVRTKSSYDGAMPTGMSVMVTNLVELVELTANDAYRNQAVDALMGVSHIIAGRPGALIVATTGLHSFLKNNPVELLLGDSGDDDETVAISIEQLNPEDVTDRIVLRMTLAVTDGFHINAHEPDNPSLQPLGIELAGSSGLTLEAAYPDGTRIDGPAGSMFVHEGDVVIEVALVRTGPVAGEPMLIVRYQACDDSKCLRPRARVIPVRLNQ